MLLDDSTRMAAHAREAGVDVILDITADVPHVFQAFAGVLDEADEALERAALSVSQRIRTRGTAHTGRLKRADSRIWTTVRHVGSSCVTRVHLTGSEWGFVEPYLPIGAHEPYPERLRQQFEGVIRRFRTGGQWREMPVEFSA